MSDIVGKYAFPVADAAVKFYMPPGTEFLYVAMQHGMVTLWARVDTEARCTQERVFYVHGTGHPLSPYEKYVGTALDGSFVWHLFEATL